MRVIDLLRYVVWWRLIGSVFVGLYGLFVTGGMAAAYIALIRHKEVTLWVIVTGMGYALGGIVGLWALATALLLIFSADSRASFGKVRRGEY